MRIFAVLALMVVVARAAVVTPPPYNPCPTGFTMDTSVLPTRDLNVFLNNLLHYNHAPNDLMNGFPKGPFFDVDPARTCSWIPNGAFDCWIRLFSTSALTQQIGEAHLQSNDFILNNDAIHSAGGYLNFTSTFSLTALPNASFPNSPTNRNYRPLTTLLYFQPKQVTPETGNAIANRVENITVGANVYEYLTLWGSDGYDPASDSYLPNVRGTGFDLRFRLSCVVTPPPILPSCPCDDPRGVFSRSYSSLPEASPVRVTGPGFCVELDWSA